MDRAGSPPTNHCHGRRVPSKDDYFCVRLALLCGRLGSVTLYPLGPDTRSVSTLLRSMELKQRESAGCFGHFSVRTKTAQIIQMA